MRFHYFIDFDGTISLEDVGTRFFLEFGSSVDDFLALDNAWLVGEISSADLYRRACALIRVTPAEFQRFLATQDIDPAFIEFVRRAREVDDRITVVSDGFSNYILPILERYVLDHLEVVANTFAFEPATGGITPSFPFIAQSCGKCANCKGSQIRRLRSAGLRTVLIGDGNSDTCGARLCDHVFARSELALFCRTEGIEFIAFENFHDIQKQVEKIRDYRRAG